jgi:nucleotide-binding universal stress UspA family protein
MPPLYRSILCPVDFDENSRAALRHAARLASSMDATVHLLHITTIIPTASEIVQSADPHIDPSARRQLQKLADSELAGVKHQIHSKLAFASLVPKTILAIADEVKADVIVIATHGRSGLPRLLLGSVAEAVVRNATRPVLTIRP